MNRSRLYRISEPLIRFAALCRCSLHEKQQANDRMLLNLIKFSSGMMMKWKQRINGNEFKYLSIDFSFTFSSSFRSDMQTFNSNYYCVFNRHCSMAIADYWHAFHLLALSHLAVKWNGHISSETETAEKNHKIDSSLVGRYKMDLNSSWVKDVFFALFRLIESSSIKCREFFRDSLHSKDNWYKIICQFKFTWFDHDIK